MTSPLLHGYPDYGRTSARSNILFHDIEDTDIDAQEVLTLRFCGDRGYIQFFFAADTGHFDVSFRYYVSPVGAGFTVTQKFSCRQGFSLQTSDPVKGASFDVVVTPSAANSAYRFQCWGTDVPSHQGVNDDWGNLLLSEDGTAIGAGATITQTIPNVWPGPASFFAAATATSWVTRVQGINRTGAVRTIARITEAGPPGHHRLYLPRSTVRVQTTNNDGVGRNVFLFLSAHPQGLYG